MSNAAKILWLWDDGNKCFVKAQCDANGYLLVDMSAINLGDLGDVTIAGLADGHFISYSGGLGYWQNRLLAEGDIPATIARDAEVATAISDHAALTLSSTVHNNDNYFLGYCAEDIPALPVGYFKSPLTAITDLTSGIDVSDWYGASGAYRQADADSSATKIEDDDAAFPNSIKYSIVKWASDAAGTLNTGLGIVTAVDSDTLTIVKCLGDDFAANYYYWIKHAEWTVPVTGLYLAIIQAIYTGAEADKEYYFHLQEIDGTSTPTNLWQKSEYSPLTGSLWTASSSLVILTAGRKIFYGGYQGGTAGSSQWTVSATNNFLQCFLLKQTA